MGKFVTGDLVPKTAVYEVSHDSHRLPVEVTFLRGQRFPACSQCASEVRFAVADGREPPDDWTMIVNSLPHLDPELVGQHEAVNRKLCEFCRQACPRCVVAVRVGSPGTFRLRVTEGNVTLIPDRWDHDTKWVLAMSHQELWGYLESFSRQLIKRPGG